MLTERGIVSAPQGMGPRQIVMEQDQLIAILNGDDSGRQGGGETDGGDEGQALPDPAPEEGEPEEGEFTEEQP